MKRDFSARGEFNFISQDCLKVTEDTFGTRGAESNSRNQMRETFPVMEEELGARRNPTVTSNVLSHSPVIGVHHTSQQSQGEDPGRSLPCLATAQPPLQLTVYPGQAEACHHTHHSIALQPETLHLQTASNVHTPTQTHLRGSCRFSGYVDWF